MTSLWKKTVLRRLDQDIFEQDENIPMDTEDEPHVVQERNPTIHTVERPERGDLEYRHLSL